MPSSIQPDRAGPASNPPLRAVVFDPCAEERARLRSMFLRHPSLTVAAEAASVPEALTALVGSGADLIFWDAGPDRSPTFDHCHLVPAAVRIVFLSSREGDAMKAFEYDGLDFLLKPLTPPRLAECVRRILRIEWARPKPVMEPGAKLLLPFERGRRGASLDEIRSIQAFGNYTRVVLPGGKSEIVLRSLAKWQQILPMPPFLRVHRNTIANALHVKALEENGGGFVLRLAEADEPLPVSRRCVPEVRRVLFRGGAGGKERTR